jgi:aminocarboxymuconate-semialdehyde decarboxylase
MSNDWNRYGPTAARPPGAKPGRMVRPNSVTIDIHSHIAVPRASEFVKPHLDLATIPLAHYAAPDTKVINVRQDKERRPLMTSYDQRLADLDAMGIDLQLVMCPPPQCYYTVPVDIAVAAARMINDGIAEYVAGKPDRFIALGTVPMPDGAAAASELERCMTTLKFKGVQILTNVAGKELSDPAFAPFWAKAEALGAVVERHPNLKLIAVHGGGFLGAYSGRIDHAWGARGDARADLPKPPSSYLKKIYFDTVVFTPNQLAALVETFGVDHVMMGTDYPYDMGEYDPIEHLVATKSLDQTAVAAIAGGNAKRLFGV